MTLFYLLICQTPVDLGLLIDVDCHMKFTFQLRELKEFKKTTNFVSTFKILYSEGSSSIPVLHMK